MTRYDGRPKDLIDLNSLLGMMSSPIDNVRLPPPGNEPATGLQFLLASDSPLYLKKKKKYIQYFLNLINLI